MGTLYLTVVHHAMRHFVCCIYEQFQLYIYFSGGSSSSVLHHMIRELQQVCTLACNSLRILWASSHTLYVRMYPASKYCISLIIFTRKSHKWLFGRAVSSFFSQMAVCLCIITSYACNVHSRDFIFVNAAKFLKMKCCESRGCMA